MIENPQLAQSYILLTILRQERDRLLSKTRSIPNLHSQVHELEYNLGQKIAKGKEQRQQRKLMIEQLQEQLGDKLHNKKVAKKHAEAKILELRRNMNQIRRMSVEGLELKKQAERDKQQIQQLMQQIQEIDVNLKQQQKRTNEINSGRSMLKQEVEIGKNRVSNLFQIYSQLRNRAADGLQISLSLQQQISHHSSRLAQLEFQSESISNQLYHTKIEIFKYEQQLEQKKSKIQALTHTMQLIQKSNQPLQTQVTQLTNEIESLEQKLQTSLHECQQMNGQLVTISAQANNLERDNKLNAHKIQCVLMLVKRLHGYRDRMIVLRRNNMKKSGERPNATDRGGLLSRMSRAQMGSEVSISLLNQSQTKQHQEPVSSPSIKSNQELK